VAADETVTPFKVATLGSTLGGGKASWKEQNEHACAQRLDMQRDQRVEDVREPKKPRPQQKTKEEEEEEEEVSGLRHHMAGYNDHPLCAKQMITRWVTRRGAIKTSASMRA
jgi:hypothetical protein